MMSQKGPGSITKVSRLNSCIQQFKVKILQFKGNSHAPKACCRIFAFKLKLMLIIAIILTIRKLLNAKKL